MADLEPILARLRAQVSRGEPVLLTGAGFSFEACDTTGQTLPSSNQLTEEFWHLAFPGEPYDPTTDLGDAYFAAKQSRGGDLLRHIQSRLSVQSETLPEFYRTWFSLP